MGSLAESVPHMSNREVLGLARNRFIGVDIQNAILEKPYRRAWVALAENSGIDASAIEELWNKRGYALKCSLIQSGHIAADKYSEVYNMMRPISAVRALDTFVGMHWYPHSPGPKKTPSDLLNRIWDDQIHYSALSPWRVRGFCDNQNCDIMLLTKVQAHVDTLPHHYREALDNSIRERLICLSKQEAQKYQ
tara:strand:+ start:175 stop:750 length:576 start_codon:yes stop_codon:yes gene_type:complete